jgi:Mce-associated membrane protein
VASARPGPTVTERSSRSRVIALLVVTTALGVVLSAVGGILLLLDPSGGDGDSKDRNAVISRANDFAVAYNTYEVQELADYQKRLKGLLTPSYDKEFVKITDAVFKALESKKQKSGDAKVVGTAVDSIDKDSAVALVAVDSKITNTDNEAAVLRHFRWKVSFVKSKGEWRISTFESVAPVQAEATPSTPSPSSTEGGAE